MYDILLFQLHSCSFCLYIDRGLRLVPMVISLHFGEDIVAIVNPYSAKFLKIHLERGVGGSLTGTVALNPYCRAWGK